MFNFLSRYNIKGKASVANDTSKFITNFGLSHFFSVLYIHNLNITLKAKILKLKLSDFLDMKKCSTQFLRMKSAFQTGGM